MSRLTQAIYAASGLKVEQRSIDANRVLAQRDELLEALQLLVAGIERSVSPTYIPLQKARAAIAKATEGES